ncbi:hypothetical protein FB567DRAFT_329684 [Paraphoma chrysanthemicola]|uniref:Uncharacterized protein n=1 Tax=Paraphoma chrysanthemicola TaxID=798071 RepID=A0A8K0VZ52_9PLEO|nr:hypothetical protein FB567DRAFT_329684 [Paraphoma chrysanthemicola]
MSFLTRPASVLRSAALRPAMATIPRARGQVRFATSDYGSGAGNPAGETPQQQGKNESENLEHPGPAPPKVAQGKSSSSPDNDDATGQTNPQKSSSSASAGQQSQSNDGASQQGSKNSGGDKSVKGAQPKILSDSPPSKENEPEDVKQHNKEMENRTEKAHQQVKNEDAPKDKVSQGYWKGTSSEGVQ